jgi:ABC-type bacteriocin/lantibiotic exporter with double-glycine peptidase domain
LRFRIQGGQSSGLTPPALLYQSLLADSVAARRLLEILDASAAPVPHIRQTVLRVLPRRYELHQLSFGYTEQRLCLRNLDLCLRAGQTIAVIGPTGGGKSTLLRILCGLEDRYQGRFLVDGHDLSGINRDSYLRYVSWVPQSPFFFSGPIRGNLPGNGSLTAQHLRKCTAVLGLDTAIDGLPEGFDARLGSAGIRLSAGQYQKLAVLRAILKDAAVLLLDEPTASLDIESERKLLQGVLALRRPDCLTVLVTHHIPLTVEPWIDEIVVLVNGSIAERGSSAELREQGGFYHHWLDLCRGTTQDIPAPSGPIALT